MDNYGNGAIGANAAKQLRPKQIMSNRKFKKISSGDYCSFAIDVEGNLWGWGENFYGDLGDGTTTNRGTPIQIKAGTKFKDVSGSYNVGRAIDINGNLWMWGGTNHVGSTPIIMDTSKKYVEVRGKLAIDEQQNLWEIISSSNKKAIKPGTKFLKTSETTSNYGAIDTNGNLWIWGTRYSRRRNKRLL